MIKTRTISETFTSTIITSYERSTVANLDYAVNRSYSSGQGRFTSVDPIGMSSGSINYPQSNNLFTYTLNNPIDFVDPTGLNLQLGGNSYCWFTSQLIDDKWVIVGIHCMNTGGGDNGGGNGGGSGGGVVKSQTDCSKKPLTQILVRDDSSDGAVTKYPYVASEIYPDLQKAFDEINSTIGHIGFTELFRPKSHQQDLTDRFKRGDPNIVREPAAPGTSAHESGYSIDLKDSTQKLKSPTTGKTVKQILEENGFSKNVPDDNVHFTHKSAPPKGKIRNAKNKEMNAYYEDCLQGKGASAVQAAGGGKVP